MSNLEATSRSTSTSLETPRWPIGLAALCIAALLVTTLRLDATEVERLLLHRGTIHWLG